MVVTGQGSSGHFPWFCLTNLLLCVVQERKALKKRVLEISFLLSQPRCDCWAASSRCQIQSYLQRRNQFHLLTLSNDYFNHHSFR